MAGITHDKVLTGSDGTNPNRAQPSDWNADHVLPDPLDLTGDLNVDTIDESTTDAGVTVEGVLLKDSAINFGDEDLDTYDEGEWTPELGFQNAGDESWSFGSQVGRYTRIGNVVFARCYLTTSSMSYTTASGQLRLKGLPFTAAGSEGYAGGIMMLSHVGVGNGFAINSLTTTEATFQWNATGGINTVNVGHITTGETPTVRGCIIYEV